MTRVTLGATNRAEVVKAAIRYEYFVQIILPSLTLRAHTGDVDVVWGGNTWTGNARFIGFDSVNESADLKARRSALQLPGVDTALVSAAMLDKYHFSQTQLYIGLFDEAGALVADPHQIGGTLYCSDMVLNLDVKTGTLTVGAESVDVFNRRNSEVLATPESQKRRYPGDTSMDKVRTILDMEIEWGGVRYSSGGGGGCPATWVPVRVEGGEEIRADALRPGARVVAWDEETMEAGIHVVEDVTFIEAQLAMVVLADGRRIEASLDHPFYVREKGWTKIADLAVGDDLVGDLPGSVASITRTRVATCVRVAIAGAHTFMTAGILSHNKTLNQTNLRE